LRLRIDGGLWSHVEVIEITSTGLLVEAPREPVVSPGHTVEVEVSGRRGVLVVVAVHRPEDGDHAYLSIRIAEQDPGFVAALGQASSWRTRTSMRVTSRTWPPGTAPVS
jgi:hypothetical protein